MRALVLPGYSMTVVTFTQANATTKPVAPSMVYALPGANKVDLLWTAMTGATSYDVYRAEKGTAPKLLKSNVATHTFRDTTVASGKSYAYRVVAKNAKGASTQSSPGLAKVVAAPGTVKNLQAVAADNQVTLNWDAAPGATDYTVKRATSANRPFTVLTTHPYKRNYDQSISSTTYTDREAQNGVTYHYTVEATTSGGSSPVTKIAVTPQALPSLWRTVDVNGGRNDGSARYDAASGKWTLSGSGEAWYNHGQGRFVYQQLSGDGSITARVLSGESGRYEKNIYGVIMRERPSPGGFWITMSMSPTNKENNFTQGSAFLRSDIGQGSAQDYQEGLPLEQRRRIPYWVRLERKGNTITASTSADGKTWQQENQTTWASMPQDLYVGLVANSMVYYATRTGEFDNVTVTGKTSAP